MDNIDFSPFDPNSSEPKSKRLRIGASKILQTNITPPVISSATNCLLVAAKSSKVRGLRLDTCVRLGHNNDSLIRVR